MAFKAQQSVCRWTWTGVRFPAHEERDPWGRGCSPSFSSSEAALLLVSTKNRDLWNLWERGTSNTGSPRFTDFASLCACPVSSLANLIGSGLNLLCLHKAIQNWNAVGPGQGSQFQTHEERDPWGRGCSTSFSFSEAAVLLVSTKNRDLWNLWEEGTSNAGSPRFTDFSSLELMLRVKSDILIG